MLTYPVTPEPPESRTLGTYFVTAEMIVQGVYAVQARSEQEARQKAQARRYSSYEEFLLDEDIVSVERSKGGHS